MTMTEKILTDEDGDRVSLSNYGGQIYIEVHERGEVARAAGPFTAVEIREVLDDIARETT